MAGLNTEGLLYANNKPEAEGKDVTKRKALLGKATLSLSTRIGRVINKL